MSLPLTKTALLPAERKVLSLFLLLFFAAAPLRADEAADHKREIERLKKEAAQKGYFKLPEIYQYLGKKYDISKEKCTELMRKELVINSVIKKENEK